MSGVSKADFSDEDTAELGLEERITVEEGDGFPEGAIGDTIAWQWKGQDRERKQSDGSEGTCS